MEPSSQLGPVAGGYGGDRDRAGLTLPGCFTTPSLPSAGLSRVGNGEGHLRDRVGVLEKCMAGPPSNCPFVNASENSPTL